MKIRIRIYADKEPDLYALYRACGPALTRKIFRQSTVSYITGQSFDLQIPSVSYDTKDDETKNPMFDFTVPAEHDGSLAMLPSRQTSTFVKTLVRYYAFWALSDAFGIKHQVKTHLPNDTSLNDAETENIADSKKPQNTQKKKADIKKYRSATETTEDLHEIENSDANGLAALFGGIKMG